MTLRPVSTERRDLITPDGHDVEPRLAWLPISRLVIDERYQRPLARSNWKAIEKIAANFRWHRFTPVLAAAVDGTDTFALIDGQHRSHAAALAGFSQVPAMVVDLTFEEQASSFSWINGQVTAISGFHKFKAALCAGDPVAVEADQILRDAGAQMMTYQPSAATKKPRQVFCIGLILTAVDVGRGAHVRRVIQAISGSQRSDDVWYWGADVIGVLLMALRAQIVPDGFDLTGFIDATDFLRIQHGAGRMREDPKFSGQTQKSLFRDLIFASLKKRIAA